MLTGHNCNSNLSSEYLYKGAVAVMLTWDNFCLFICCFSENIAKLHVPWHISISLTLKVPITSANQTFHMNCQDIFYNKIRMLSSTNLLGTLTLVLLNPEMPFLCKQCRSRSVGFWTDLDLHCLPFCMWIYINILDQVIWLAENWKWAWHLNLFSMTRVKLITSDNTVKAHECVAAGKHCRQQRS